MKISVITPRYAIAGVPLAQIRFARALATKGHDVDLIFGCIDETYQLPPIPGVNVINLVRPKVRGMFIPLLQYLRRKKPEVIFSAEDHLTVIVLLAAIVTRSKAIISGSSRVIPYDAEAYSKKLGTKGWCLKKVMEMVMWRADALTCVSKDMVGLYKSVFENAPHVYAYNIIVNDDLYARMREPLNHEWFLYRDCPIVVAAGALAAPKGFADLIQAMGLLNRKQRVRLLILGDGPQRPELETLIVSLGLTDLVSLQIGRAHV